MKTLSKQINSFIILFFFSILFLASCKSTEKITKPIIKPTLSSEDIIFENIRTIDPLFSTMNSKLEIKSKGMSLGGSIRMKKDSIIWVSITKFGIEGARVKLTKDSVFFINKLYAEAFSGDYNFFSSLLGFKVDFGIIQSFILAKDFDNYDTKGYKIEKNNDNLLIRFENRQTKDISLPSLKQNILYNSQESTIIRNYLEIIKNQKSMDVEYSSFVNVQGIKIPSQYNILIPEFAQDKIQIRLSNHNLNQKLEYPFSIPGSYKRIN